MSSVISSRIPSHTLQSLVKVALKPDDSFKSILPDIPDILTFPLYTSSKPKKHHTDSDTEESKTNERFYIDETHMIERRFLEDDTKDFEMERDVDPFAEASLVKTPVDSLLNNSNISDFIKKAQADAFLSGKTLNSNMITIATLLKDTNIFDTQRLRSKMEWEYTDADAMGDLLDSKASEWDHIFAIAHLTGTSVVYEEENGIVRVAGPSPLTPKDTIYWIRCVVDGYLGINMNAEDAETRFKMTSGLKRTCLDNSCLIDVKNGMKVSNILLNKKLKVSHLKEFYNFIIGEELKGRKKKNEIINELSERMLWGIHLPKSDI